MGCFVAPATQQLVVRRRILLLRPALRASTRGETLCGVGIPFQPLDEPMLGSLRSPERLPELPVQIARVEGRVEVVVPLPQEALLALVVQRRAPHRSIVLHCAAAQLLRLPLVDALPVRVVVAIHACKVWRGRAFVRAHVIPLRVTDV